MGGRTPLEKREAAVKEFLAKGYVPYVQPWSDPLRPSHVARTNYRYAFICIPFKETGRRVWLFESIHARKRFIQAFIDPLGGM